MYQKNLFFITLVFLFSGCSSMTYSTKQEVKEINKPVVTEIQCVILDACNAKASELCAQGYNVLKTSEVVPYVLNKMEVVCKTKEPPAPVRALEKVEEKKDDSKVADEILQFEKELQIKK